MEEKVLKGTTTVGVTFKDGVVIAADKRASAGTFIASRRAKKVHKITKKIVFTISGLVADAQILVKWVRTNMSNLARSTGREPLVSEVANLTASVLHQYFRTYIPFIVHFIIGGVDIKGPHLYFIDHAGGINRDKYLATGSGSPVAIGILEDGFKENMEKEEAIKLALRALRGAIRRDAATGDGIDLVVVTEEGVKFYTPKEIDSYLSGLKKVFSEG
ncbi:MAG: proteasome subunit beta [Candidatus Njordarchaeia archaeon]